MSKGLKKNDLAERPVAKATLRMLLAVSLSASIAAFGCTTDRSVGNGEPVVTPGLRNSPTGGAATGTETESIPPPMMSSYSGVQARSAVRPRISREEAALLLTEMQPRVKVLGPVSPGPSGRVYVSDRIALNLQPETRSTINSSIYSPAPAEGIISGAGEGVAGTTATIAGSTVVTNPDAAVIAPTTAANATPTGSAIMTPSALPSVRTLSPTAAAVVNPPASISSSSTLATTSSARTAPSIVTAGTANTQAVAAQPQPVSATSVSGTAASSAVNPVRVVTANGRMTVTNAAPTSSRQQ